MNVLGEESQGSAKIPALLYMFYQSMFAAVTQVIAVGGAAERSVLFRHSKFGKRLNGVRCSARMAPILVNCVLWGTIVYAPIAH